MILPALVTVHALGSSLAAPLAAAVPPTMQAVRTSGGCNAPFACVKVESVPTPKPRRGEALIKIQASSVNPSDRDTVEGGGCGGGCGADVSGTVVACSACTRLKPGDAVWTLGRPAYAEYVAVPEFDVALKPESLDFLAAGTVPEVGLTSLLSLLRTGSAPGTPLPAGSPWANFTNLTVAVTAGSGGTGSIGIELAKAWGAKHIATATTGSAGIAFVRSLGATFVTDYKQEDLWDALPENSVDIVYDNYAADGTADKAMRAIRPGGMYLMMPHGECYAKKMQAPPCISANPKPGVRQLNYNTGPDFALHARAGLERLSALFEASELSAHVDKNFSLDNAAQAFAYSAGSGSGGVGEHIGKVAITMA